MVPTLVLAQNIALTYQAHISITEKLQYMAGLMKYNAILLLK
jgi:hypothetical protein